MKFSNFICRSCDHFYSRKRRNENKMAAARKYVSNRRINDANSIQQGLDEAHFLSQVINLETVTGKFGVSLAPSDFPFTCSR